MDLLLSGSRQAGQHTATCWPQQHWSRPVSACVSVSVNMWVSVCEGSTWPACPLHQPPENTYAHTYSPHSNTMLNAHISHTHTHTPYFNCVDTYWYNASLAPSHINPNLHLILKIISFVLPCDIIKKYLQPYQDTNTHTHIQSSPPLSWAYIIHTRALCVSLFLLFISASSFLLPPSVCSTATQQSTIFE